MTDDDYARRLAAALPTVEPTPDLAERTLQHIDAAEASRKRWKRRALIALFTPLAAAAAVLFTIDIYYRNLTPNSTNLEVYGQDHMTFGSSASVRVRLTDARTQAPLVGVPVQVDVAGRTQAMQLAKFTTDASGTGCPTFTVNDFPNFPDGSYWLTVTSGSSFLNREQISRPIQLRRESRLMLSTDKPVYQPGQTIHLRALTLRRPDNKPVVDADATFTLTDPKGNVVFKHAGKTSRFGLTSADCPLATEILEGDYTVACTVGPTSSKATVSVQKYVLPRIAVGVEFDKPFYRPGDRVRGTLRADYFYGKSVAGGKAVVEAAGVAKVALSTGADGRAAFEFDVPAPFPAGELTVAVTVRDAAGQEGKRSLRRPVSADAVMLEMIPENGTLVAGLANRIYVTAQTPDGRPQATTVRVMLGGQHEVTTNALGVGSFEFTPLAGSQYGVLLETTQGPPGRISFTTQTGQPSDNFLVRTDKAVYVAGETLHFAAVGGGPEPVFVDLLRDGQTIRTDTAAMNDGHATLDVELPPDLAGTLELCAYRFDASGRAVRKLRTLYVRPASELKLTATADKGEYRPGETAKLALTLTDAAGKPTPGAVSLAAVDEAVFAVAQAMPGMERTFFLLEQELLKPVLTPYGWSPDAPTVPERREFEQAIFARTAQTDDGSRPFSLTAATYTEKAQAVAERKANAVRGLERAFGWLLFAGIATLYAGAWIVTGHNAFARMALAGVALVGVFLVCLVPSMLVVRESAMPFGEAKSKSEGEPRPAQGIDARDFSGSMNVEGGLVRVREKFPETLLWVPQLVTDAAGRATLDVPLADAITTWRLSASAVAADGRLGAVQSGVRVFQPFFVDLTLPVALTRGDEVTVPVVVSNYLTTPLAVDLALADAGWFERIGNAPGRVELRPGEVKAVPVRLRAKAVGTHTLDVTARANGVADAIRRQIEVVPDGRKVEHVVNGSLAEPVSVNIDVPADAIPGSAKAVVKLYPSGFSQLVEGLDGIFRMPSGCFEQTSSTTYPNVLALDYLKTTGMAQPAVEAKARQYVHLGYQRLVSFEVPGGGFDWYGRPPASVPLTAYGLMEFADMARVHAVDPALIDRTRRWLLARRAVDGSWSDDHGHAFLPDAGPPWLRTTAYVAWAVFGAGTDADPTPTREFLLRHPPETIADSNLLALVCNALLAMDAKHPATAAYLSRLDALKRSSDDGKLTWYSQPPGTRTQFYGAGQSASIETTALAALAFLKAGDRPNVVRQALAWLVTQKDANGTWHSTQATVLALKALVAGSGKPLSDGERVIELALDGQPPRTLTIPADQAEVMKQIDLSSDLTPGRHQLTLTERTKSAAGFQVAFRYHVPGVAAPTEPEPFAVTLAYARTELAVHESVQATAMVTNRTASAVPMVMLDLPIPAGFAVDPEALDALVQAQTIGKYQVTPRQVIVYLRGLKAGESLTLRYALRATTPAAVAVPAARAYEYYDPAKEGRSAAARLVVK
ncbi:MAG: MG2 domain-containing protein [Gemmataceae bacterium]